MRARVGSSFRADSTAGSSRGASTTDRPGEDRRVAEGEGAGGGAGTGAAWTVGWSALKSGLVGASASGPVLPIDSPCFGLTCAGAAPVFGAFAAGGGTLPAA